jgi:hypothetical protein
MVATRELPVFLCEPIRSGFVWRFWCPFCRGHHEHGAKDGALPGHRLPHCHTEQGKRALQSGYLLRLDPRHRISKRRAA